MTTQTALMGTAIWDACHWFDKNGYGGVGGTWTCFGISTRCNVSKQTARKYLNILENEGHIISMKLARGQKCYMLKSSYEEVNNVR